LGHLYTYFIKISPFAMPCVRHAADDRGEHESSDEWEQHQVDQTLQPIITHSGQSLHIILHRHRQRQHRWNTEENSVINSLPSLTFFHRWKHKGNKGFE